MAAATTKNVTGFVKGLSDDELTGASLLLDLDPAFVVVGSTVIVGEQNDGTKGVSVAIGSDGSFTVPIVAVDNPTWTIKVTVTGPNVETPASFEIQPPPLSGTGDVTIDQVLVQGSAGTTPVLLSSIRGSSDYDNSVAPTDGQYPAWNAAEGKFKPTTPSSGGSGTGLPSGGTVGQTIVKNSSTDGDASWQTPPTALTQTQANGLYAPLAAGLPILAWNGAAYPAKPASVTNGIYVGDPSHTPPPGPDFDIWAQPGAGS